MIPKYVPIMRAMQGEFEAFSHLPYVTQQSILPVFELPRFTIQKQNTVKYRGLQNPTQMFLNDVLSKIKEARSELPLMIDINRWSPDSVIENGEHILSYSINRLNSMEMPVVPIIGYDRWEDQDYTNVFMNLDNLQQRYCIRLESFAFEDMLEEEYFIDNIESIIATLGIDTNRCSVLLDFGDVTQVSTIEMQEVISRAQNLLSQYEFEFISLAGCSISQIINEMVPDHNSTGTVIRREMIAWQASFRNGERVPLVFGDYGVVYPSLQEDIIAPDANGKIRYTFRNNYLIARGHSRRQGNKGQQMWDLSRMIMNSPAYMGSGFSWGDLRINECSNQDFMGNPSQWVAIDTNHHIHTILTEVFEFERTTEREAESTETA